MINRLLNRADLEKLLEKFSDIKIAKHKSPESDSYQAFFIHIESENAKVPFCIRIQKVGNHLVFLLNDLKDHMVYKKTSENSKHQNSIRKINELKEMLKVEITEHVKQRAKQQKINLMLKDMKVSLFPILNQTEGETGFR